jgi:MoxR-like ATPase
MADPQPTTGSVAKAAEGAAPVNDKQLVAQGQEAFESIRGELAKVIVGQDKVIEELLIAIFARGHCMLEGVPGLAKTLLISTLARTLHLSFKRIQFTPDLMPSDIVGTEVLQEDPVTKARVFKFLRGPIFSNIVLADEINRTPPKTQAALLEAMQEKSVSIGNDQFKLDQPFFVLATQNPIDQEGTYPLPEAQLDRFLFKVFVGYPSDDEELEIMRRVASPAMANAEKGVRQVLNGEQIKAFQQRPCAPLRQGAGAGDPPGHPRGAGFHQGVDLVGRRPARQHQPHPRGQGAGGALWPVPRHRRRHRCSGGAGA